MKKKIYFKKKNNIFYLIIILTIIIASLLYFLLFFISINKPYFKIVNNINEYYYIPIDKGGEKIKYLNKKSINNDYNTDYQNDSKNNNFVNLAFTIQIYSNPNLILVKKYKENFIKLKKEIIDENDLNIISIKSDIGTDYFLTFKNFSMKKDALNFCNNFHIFNECIIINPSDL